MWSRAQRGLSLAACATASCFVAFGSTSVARAAEPLTRSALVTRNAHVTTSVAQPQKRKEKPTVAPPADDAVSADPVLELGARIEALVAGRAVLDDRSCERITGLIGDTRLVAYLDPGRAHEVAWCLLDVVGAFLDANTLPEGDQAAGCDRRLRDTALEALRGRADLEFKRMLAQEVLALPRLQPRARRLAAAAYFELEPSPVAKLALLAMTREDDGAVRRAALEALVGWQDEAVHATFVAELEANAAGRMQGFATLAERHFASARPETGSRSSARLASFVTSTSKSSDWRVVSRAIALSAPLPDAAAVPLLIETMKAWIVRRDAGAQALRILHELEDALETRAGTTFGLLPSAWADWWSAVQEGRMRPSAARVEQNTRAGFFGLRPNTDRILFVIDRSGSMDGPFRADRPQGTAARRRWDEALHQLTEFIEGLGPRARFDVVLFHDMAEAWRGRLMPVSKENVNLLRRWLAVQHPAGGTRLRAGIEAALSLGRDGKPDLKRLEADTVIVLCDGATTEGPAWIADFLRDTNAAARLRFHTVLIGTQEDGALDQLARGSGGESVRVDG